jgi:hypothetical protein
MARKIDGRYLVGLLHPEAKIELSTNWVQTYQTSETARKLGPSLRPWMIGAAYHTGIAREGLRDMPRGLQEMGDVALRQPASWSALDDDPTGWPSDARSKLVLTHGLHGLGEERAQLELKAKLRALASN